MRASIFLALHNLKHSRLRTSLSALAVTLGVGMILAASVTSSGIRQVSETGSNLMRWLTDVIEIGLTAIGFVIFVAAGFLIFNAFAMSITQRRRQIGLLRSLGMTRRQVLRQVLLEALLTGGLGTVLGLLAGPLFGAGLLDLMRHVGVQVGRGSVSPASLRLAIALGLVIPTLSVMVPAWRATRISPLVALRQESAAGQERTPLGWARLGLSLGLVLAAYLILAPPGRWTGNHPPWQWLVPLLLSPPWLAAMMLTTPALIGGLGWVARRADSHVPTGATLRLMSDNLGRDRLRVTLTTLALAVGLTMVTTQNGFVAFINEGVLPQAAQGALGQTTWFIYPFDRTNGLAQLDDFNTQTGIKPEVQADVYRLVKGRAEVSESYMVVISQIGSPMPGFPSTIADLNDLIRPSLYTFVEGNWETARPIMETGCGLLLPPTVAASNRVHPGDRLTLPGLAGPVDCTVAGIGYGGIVPMSLISLAAKDAFVAGPPLALTIWPQTGADVAALGTDLHALVERHGGDAWLSTPEEEMQSVLDTSDQMQVMTDGLLVLAVVTAALGVVNTTMMSVTERRCELGLLRAVGATHRQVTAVVVGEAALMGLVGGGLGLIAGVGLTAIFGLSFGGIPFGLMDLDLWNAIGRGIQPVLLSGLLGITITPLVSAGAAWLTSRSTLRDSAIQALQTER